MNSRSSFKNHTQFQTLTLTSNPRANPNNPPPPPTKDQHFESEEQPSNSQHNAFQTAFRVCPKWNGDLVRHSSFLKILFAALLIVCRMNQPFAL